MIHFGLGIYAKVSESQNFYTCTTWTNYAIFNMIISNLDLINVRDGCIICMDYSDYNKDYPFLITHFKAITKVLTDKLIHLRDKGLRSSDAYLFGFSYGARLITKAGHEIGPRQLGIIHRKTVI